MFPIQVYAILKGNWHRLKEPDVIAKYGSLYEDLNVANKLAIWQKPFYLTRRFILLYSVMFVKVLLYQLLVLYYSIILQLVYVGLTRPYNTSY